MVCGSDDTRYSELMYTKLFDQDMVRFFPEQVRVFPEQVRVFLEVVRFFSNLSGYHVTFNDNYSQITRTTLRRFLKPALRTVL